MTPRAIARLRASMLLLLALMATAPRVEAQPPSRDSFTSTEDQRKAQDHFARARELYLGGSYREAIAELEVARKLDPRAKDLVLNLAIVHEKLGKYDEALVHLHTYLEMDGVTPAERTRAEGMSKRLEGAKQRAAASAKPTPPPDLVRSPPPPSGPPPAVGPPPRGRWDGYTLGAVIIGGVGIAAGAAVGLWALSERPTDFVTGRDGSYGSFRNKTSSAHHAAVASDVFFGVGLVSVAAAIALYFARPRDAAPASPALGSFPSLRSLHVSALPAGGAVGLGGAF